MAFNNIYIHLASLMNTKEYSNYLENYIMNYFEHNFFAVIIIFFITSIYCDFITIISSINLSFNLITLYYNFIISQIIKIMYILCFYSLNL